MTPKRKPAKGPAPPRAPKRWLWLPKAEWGVALLLTAAAIAYHVWFFLKAGDLWRDEVNSFEFARMPLGTAFASLQHDSFPFLPTLLLHGWLAVGGGGSETAIRIFGLLVGLFLLGGLWLTARLFRCDVPLLSLALLGLNPWVVRTVDSVRPYGIGMVLFVAALGCVWRAAESGRRKWILLAGTLALLSVQCMYQNALLLLALCIAGAVVAWRGGSVRNAGAVLAVGLVAALSLLVYRSSLAAARDWSIVNQAPVPWKALRHEFETALCAGSRVALWGWGAVAILTAAIGVHSLRRRSSLALFAAAFALLATLVYLVAIKGTRVPTQPWYYVPLAVAAAPALDAALRAQAADARRAVRLVLALLLAGAVAVPGWNQLRERRTNMDLVASILAKRASAGDVVVVYPFFFGVSFHRYYHGPAAWLTIPPISDLRIHRYDLLKRLMSRPQPIEPVYASVAQALRTGHKVWLVGGLPPSDPKHVPLPPPPLPNTGWYMGPYMFSWGREAAGFLESHALSAEVVDTSTGEPVSHYENASIQVLAGWH